MKKLVFVLIVLALAAIGGRHLWQELSAKQLGEKLTGELSPTDQVNREATALLVTRDALKELENPNLSAHLATADLSRVAEEALRVAARNFKVKDFKKLEVRAPRIATGRGSILLSAAFEAELATAPIRLEGNLDMTVAPAFDGAGLTLIPLEVSPSLSRVDAWGYRGSETITRVVEAALRPALGLLAERVAAVSIPVALGMDQTLDLTDTLRKVPGISSVDARPATFRVALEELAVLPDSTGIKLVGRAQVVTEEQFATALTSLRGLGRERENGLPPASCEACKINFSAPGSYFTCLERSVICRMGGTLSAETPDGPAFGAIELLALHALGRSQSTEDQTTYSALRGLLRPRLSTSDPGGWTAQSLEILRDDVSSRLQAVSSQVEPALSPATGTTFAVRKDFLATALNAVLQQEVVSLTVAIPDHTQAIRETLNTGPAPELNCRKNARGCPSNFEYRGHSPRGCPSDDCRDRKCKWGICIDTINFNCLGRKADCERLKAQEKIGYEAEKAAAQALWTAEKAACEAQKQLEIAGCEVNQAWLNAFQSMDVGRIDGEAHFRKGTVAAVGLTGTLEPDLTRGKFKAQLSGSLALDASLVFTPLNAGHVLCVAQWGDDLHADLRVEPFDFDVDVDLQRVGETSSGGLVLRTPERTLGLVISPPPATALINQAPQVLVACPVPGAIAAAIAGLTGSEMWNIVPELGLLNRFEVTLPAQEIRLDLARSFGLAAMPGVVVDVQVTPTSVVMSSRREAAQ